MGCESSTPRTRTQKKSATTTEKSYTCHDENDGATTDGDSGPRKNNSSNIHTSSNNNNNNNNNNSVTTFNSNNNSNGSGEFKRHRDSLPSSRRGSVNHSQDDMGLFAQQQQQPVEESRSHFDPIPTPVEALGTDEPTAATATASSGSVAPTSQASSNFQLTEKDKTNAQTAADEYQQRIEARRKAEMEVQMKLKLEEFDPVRPLDSFNVTHRCLLGRCWDRRAAEILPVSYVHSLVFIAQANQLLEQQQLTAFRGTGGATSGSSCAGSHDSSQSDVLDLENTVRRTCSGLNTVSMPNPSMSVDLKGSFQVLLPTLPHSTTSANNHSFSVMHRHNMGNALRRNSLSSNGRKEAVFVLGNNKVSRRSHWFNVCGVATDTIPASVSYKIVKMGQSNPSTPVTPVPGNCPDFMAVSNAAKGGNTGAATSVRVSSSSPSTAAAAASGRGKSGTGASPSAPHTGSGEPAPEAPFADVEVLQSMSFAEREDYFNTRIQSVPRYKGLKETHAFKLGSELSDTPETKFLRKRGLAPAAGVQVTRWNRVEVFNPTLRTLLKAVAYTEGKTVNELVAGLTAEEDVQFPLEKERHTHNGKNVYPAGDGVNYSDDSFGQHLLGQGRVNKSFANPSFMKSSQSRPNLSVDVSDTTSNRNGGTVVKSGLQSSYHTLRKFPEESVLSLVLANPPNVLAQLRRRAEYLQAQLQTPVRSNPGEFPLGCSVGTPLMPTPGNWRSGEYDGTSNAGSSSSPLKSGGGSPSMTSKQAVFIAVSVNNFSASIDPFHWEENGYTRCPVDCDHTSPEARRVYGEGIITDIMYGGTMVIECSSAKAAAALEGVLAEMSWTENRNIASIVGDIRKAAKRRKEAFQAMKNGKKEVEDFSQHRYRMCRRVGGRPMRDDIEFQQISLFFRGDLEVHKHEEVISRPAKGDDTKSKASEFNAGGGGGAAAAATASSPTGEEGTTFSRVASIWVDVQVMSAVVRTWGMHLLANPEYAQPVAMYLQRYAGIGPVLQPAALNNATLGDDALATSLQGDDGLGETMRLEEEAYNQFFEAPLAAAHRATGAARSEHDEAVIAGTGSPLLAQNATFTKRISKSNAFYTSEPASPVGASEPPSGVASVLHTPLASGAPLTGAATRKNCSAYDLEAEGHRLEQSLRGRETRRPTLDDSTASDRDEGGDAAAAPARLTEHRRPHRIPLSASCDPSGTWDRNNDSFEISTRAPNTVSVTAAGTPINGREDHSFASPLLPDGSSGFCADSSCLHTMQSNGTHIFADVLSTSSLNLTSAGSHRTPLVPPSRQPASPEGGGAWAEKRTAPPSSHPPSPALQVREPSDQLMRSSDTFDDVLAKQATAVGGSPSTRAQREAEERWNIAMLEAKALEAELKELQETRRKAEEHNEDLFNIRNLLQRCFLPHAGSIKEVDLITLYLHSVIFEPEDSPHSHLYIKSADWLSIIMAVWSHPRNTFREVEIAAELHWKDLPTLAAMAGLLHYPGASNTLEQLEINAKRLLGTSPEDDDSGSPLGNASVHAGADGKKAKEKNSFWSSRGHKKAKEEEAKGNAFSSPIRKENTVNFFKAMPKQSGNHVFGPRVPPFFVTPEQARDMLWLLLSSTVKYTSAPHVTICFRGLPSNGHSPSTFSGKLNRFFERFSATSSSNASPNMPRPTLTGFAVVTESCHDFDFSYSHSNAFAATTGHAALTAEEHVPTPHGLSYNPSFLELSGSPHVSFVGNASIGSKDSAMRSSLTGSLKDSEFVHVHHALVPRSWMGPGARVEVLPFVNIMYHPCEALFKMVSACGSVTNISHPPPIGHYHNPYNNLHNNRDYYLSPARRQKLQELQDAARAAHPDDPQVFHDYDDIANLNTAQSTAHGSLNASFNASRTSSHAREDTSTELAHGNYTCNVFGLCSEEEEARVIEMEDHNLFSNVDAIWDILLRSVKKYNTDAAAVRKKKMKSNATAGTDADIDDSSRVVTLERI